MGDRDIKTDTLALATELQSLKSAIKPDMTQADVDALGARIDTSVSKLQSLSGASARETSAAQQDQVNQGAGAGQRAEASGLKQGGGR